MKKLLGIVVLGLLLISNYSFADCYSDLKTRWDQNKNNSAYNTYDKGWQRNLTGTFTFNNPTKNTIQITQVSIKAKDGNTVYSANHNLIIDPYTKNHRIGVKLKNNFTEEVIEGYYYACRYAKAGTSSKNQYKTKNKKSDSWFKWWYLLFILPAISLLKGFFCLLFAIFAFDNNLVFSTRSKNFFPSWSLITFPKMLPRYLTSSLNDFVEIRS